MTYFMHTFLKLFFLLTPFAAVSGFISMTHGQELSKKISIAARATIAMLIIVCIIFFFGRYIRRYSRQMQKEVAESNTIVEETLQGIRSVKTFTNEFLEMARYRKRTLEIARLGMKGGRYRGAFFSFVMNN